MATRLSQGDYEAMHKLVTELSPINWGAWPSTNTWPTLAVGYTVSQFEGGGVLVNFNKAVRYGDQCSRSWTFHIARVNAPKAAARFFPPLGIS